MYLTKKDLSYINDFFFITQDALYLMNRRINSPVFYLNFIYKQDKGVYSGEYLKCDVKTFN